jgi:glutamate-1-semialdehyde 2,1-aminomutase
MVNAKLLAPEGHSGIGTTLSANMLTMAVLQASLQHLHTPQTYAPMLWGAERLAQGLVEGFRRYGLPWSLTRLGARMELQFMAAPPRNAQDVRAADPNLLQSLLHLFMLNRGVVLTPFHCMMLVSPATSAQQIDQLLNVFEQFLATLARQLKPPPPHPAKNAAGLA